MSSKECIYCGLKLRGKGCSHSPNNVHVVMEPNKCIYCGLSLRGKGCSYSPNGYHTMSSEFGAIQAEKIKDNLIFAYLVEKIQKPIKEMKAYKLGLINEKGNQIKDPTTLEEYNAWGPTDRYILQLKKVFADKLSILNTESYLVNACNLIDSDDMINENWNPEEYLKTKEYEDNLENSLSDAINLFFGIIEEANQNNIKTEKVEKILLKVLNEKII